MTITPERRTTLLDLAARAEAATGGDRELDEAIRLLTQHNIVVMLDLASGYVPASTPAYSTSLDAAMTLVPEDGFGSLVAGKWPDGKRGFSAVVMKPTRVEAEAVTPALALTAASLRARAALAVQS